MNNQPIIFSKDIITEDITPLVSAGNVLLTSRPSLNQLTNVEITTPTNNQVLKYDAGGEFWYNATGGGGGATTLAELTDVDITTTTPTNGQYLQYDTSLAIPKWVNKTPDFFSYSTNYVPLNNTLYTNQTFFSLLDTANIATSPQQVINYNDANNLTLSNGVITGLTSTKYYEVEVFIMARLSSITNINGSYELGIYNGSVGTGSIIHHTLFNVASNIIRYQQYKTIITGQTAINPVLRYILIGATTYHINTTVGGFCVNVVVKEL